MKVPSDAMKVIVAALAVAMLSACASRSNVVRCDGRLQPINSPAPTAAEREESRAGFAEAEDKREY